jgi:hypothetical protein
MRSCSNKTTYDIEVTFYNGMKASLVNADSTPAYRLVFADPPALTKLALDRPWGDL